MGPAAAATGDLWVFGEDSPVIADPFHQQHPAVSGDIAVWTDCGSTGNSCRISSRNLADDTSAVSEIAPAEYTQDDAAIYGKVIAWRQLTQTATGGIIDQIFYMDGSDLTPRPLSPSMGNQFHPAVSGSIIVWEDERGGSKQSDIYMYDLDTGEERIVCDESSKQTEPDVAGEWAVWVDNRGGAIKYGTATRNDIYARNLATGEERRITDDASQVIQSNPAIGEDKLSGNYYAAFEGDGIWLYDFQTGEKRQLDAGGFQPDLDGHVVVWKSAAGIITMYDIASGESQAVSSGDAARFNPAVSGDRIVWSDERNGNRDIYHNRLGDTVGSLAERYKPLLHFHHDVYKTDRTDFEPRTVELMVDVAGARLVTAGGDIDGPSLFDLVTNPESANHLDLPGSPANPFNDFCDEYIGWLNDDPNGYPITVYARLVPDAGAGKTVIQYWLCYYFNDWYNNHEGDWEMVQVVLDRQLRPESVAYSQHGDASTRAWGDPELLKYEDHPRVYIARGSHANYFRAGNRLRAANAWGRIDSTGEATSHFPDLRLDWYSDADGWVCFAGLWGEDSKWWWPPFTVNQGPRGPAFQGLSWDDPLAWSEVAGWQRNLEDAVFSVSAGVQLHLYDSNGNHLGPDVNGALETQIPSSEYYYDEDSGVTTVSVHEADAADGLRLFALLPVPGPVQIKSQVPDRQAGAVDINEYNFTVSVSMATAELLTNDNAGLLNVDNDGDLVVDQVFPAQNSQVLPVDFIEPGRITDLAVKDETSQSALLCWTAPGDDGSEGVVQTYEVRYSREPITDDSWFYSSSAGTLAAPQKSGMVEELEVTGLAAGTTYYFAARALDDAWQAGPLSNLTSVTTETPELSWARESAHWAGLADYRERLLTVDYLLSSIGTGTAGALQVMASVCSPAVVNPATPLPMPVGDLLTGEQMQVSIKYGVPAGIKTFRSRTFVRCTDDGGRNHWFPEQPSEGAGVV